MSQKSTPSDAFDEIHQVVLDGIGDNMASLFEPGKYGDCDPHPKPHGARGLSKHYHLSFDTNLGNGVCAIHLIPCACVACT